MHLVHVVRGDFIASTYRASINLIKFGIYMG